MTILFIGTFFSRLNGYRNQASHQRHLKNRFQEAPGLLTRFEVDFE